MSPEEKQERLKELSKPNNILSDQEIEEKEKLEEELRLIHQEETEHFTETNIKLGKGKDVTIPSKKQKKSLFDIIRNKLKKTPATWEEIQQLRLEKEKAVLKKDIAKANYERKHPEGKQRQSKTNTKNKQIEESFRSSPKDFKLMSGNNNKDKYKDLIG